MPSHRRRPSFPGADHRAILLNAIVLGLETYDSIDDEFGGLLHALNDVFLGVFTVEVPMRLLAYGRRPLDFFRSGWNVFDFVVVGAAYLPACGRASPCCGWRGCCGSRGSCR